MPQPIRMTGLHALLQPLPKPVLEVGTSLYLHPSYQDDQKQWRVIAVGPGRWCRTKKGKLIFVTPEVAVGDRVICDVTSSGAALDDGHWVVDSRQIEMKW